MINITLHPFFGCISQFDSNTTTFQKKNSKIFQNFKICSKHVSNGAERTGKEIKFM